ncbi:MAG: alkaline phosphatase family protein, partial [Solirubrobacteraceae bacterium]
MSVANPAGATVALWERLPGAKSFHRVGKATTGSSGRYAFVRVADRNRSWFATSGGLRSATVTEQVHAKVSLSSSDAYPVPGHSVSLRGRAIPSHAGQPLLLERQEGGAWKVVARERLSPRSRFSFTRRLGHRGRFTFRAALLADARNLWSHSLPASLSVSEIHKIKHVVIIMQENRSFDQYFGTFRGADGIPGVAGNPGSVPCIPDPQNKITGCDKPFHDRNDVNGGGPHGVRSTVADLDCSNYLQRKGCRMDGFAIESDNGRSCPGTNPRCSPCKLTSTLKCPDVMGYHTGRDIPNYWRYARDYVLQDRMFEPVTAWSLPAHLYMVSEWAAKCTIPNDPFSCRTRLEGDTPQSGTQYAWTDLTYLLHRSHVSWAYYIFKGIEPDCESNAQVTCKPVRQGPQTPSVWNPLPAFTDVVQDGQTRDVKSLNAFFAATKSGTLPAVSWVIPNHSVSEHPPSRVSKGQTYVTGLITPIMQSPDWRSTAIF